MKKSYILLLSLALLGCNRVENPEPAGDNLIHITIDAVAGGIDGTRTSLDGLDVNWLEGDEVALWDGSANRLFTASGSGKITTLEGEVSASAGMYYALFPYESDLEFTSASGGVSVVSSVPASQYGAAGTFGENCNISAACGTIEDNLSFKNVLSVAKFTLASAKLGGHEIKSITLTSSNPIAGDAIVKISEDGCSASAGSSTFNSITLSPSDGSAMTDGDYFISLLPNDGGSITLDFVATDGYSASKTATLSSAFKAGVIKDLGTVGGLVWKEPMHVYSKMSKAPANWEGKYLIVYEEALKALDGSITEAGAMNGEGNYKSISLDASTATLSASADVFYFEIKASGSAYTIRARNGWYIGNEGTSNALQFTEAEMKNTISVSSDGTAVITGTGGKVLQFNTGADRFRYYGAGSQKPIQLYRYTGTTTGGSGEEPGGDEPGGDGGNTGAEATGWYELPVMNPQAKGNYTVNAEDASQYYATHSFTMAGKTYRNYTVCFSADKHVPLWVAAPRHSVYSQKGTSRSDNYRPDPNIPSNLQYSSTKTGSGCNKGHMLGSAERLCCAAANNQVFYYSNIAPQLSSGFNTGGGGWNILEDFVDKFQCADTLYEVLGTYYERYTDAYGFTVNPSTISFCGRSDVGMPTMFYYALIRTKKGNSGIALKDCNESEIMCAAFVRSHSNGIKGLAVTRAEMMSISDLEKITGVTYFPNVPNAPKSTFNPSDWGL